MRTKTLRIQNQYVIDEDTIVATIKISEGHYDLRSLAGNIIYFDDLEPWAYCAELLDGGLKFFESEDDYQTWCNQR
jgi:hypothetical protein